MSLRRFAAAAAPLFNEQLAPLGDRVSTVRGHGMDYAESRQYSAGDDVRRMDWPVTARTGRPHTKVFHVERGREYRLVVDLRSPMRFGTRAAFKSTVAAHVAALAGWAAAVSGDRLGAVTLAGGITNTLPGVASATLPPLCQHLEDISSTALAGETESDVPTLADAAAAALAQGAGHAHYVVLSDLHDPTSEVEKALTMMAARGDVTCLWVLDAFEAELPGAGRIALADRPKPRQLDTGAPTVRARYADFINARQALLESLARRPGCRFRQLRTGTNVFASLDATSAVTK